MEYDFKHNATFGSDGGDIEFNNHPQREVGYSDGQLIWQPFETATTEIPKVDLTKKMYGMNYGYFANRGEITSVKGAQSQAAMYELNVNWTCLTVVNYQETYHSTVIYADHLRTPSDHDIEAFVKAAHGRGINVCLKPMVHSKDNVWRAYISFPELDMDDKNSYWSPWFESYKNFMLHYAELAQKCGVEMLCIGCEMLGTEKRANDWCYLIQEIRRVYKGILIYNTNHGHEDDQEWFDALDYIGTSAYYPVGAEYLDGPVDNSYNSLVKRWTEIRYRLDAIAMQRNKQFIFMEIGCRSVSEGTAHPWDFTLDLDYNEDEQLNFYKSCMEVFKDDPYFAGVFWWEWPTFLPENKRKDFYIHGKKTEEYLKNLYGGLK